MRNFKYFYLFAFIAITSFVVYSCSMDNFDNEKYGFINPRSNCVQDLNYATKVHTFVVFEEPDNLLTETELMMKLPKSEYFEYSICKKADGTLSSEIIAKPENANVPDYPEYTLGVPEALKWRTTNNNGIVTVYDENDTEIDSYQSDSNMQSTPDLNKLAETELVSVEDYQVYLDVLKHNFTVYNFSPTIIVITEMVDGKKFETYFDDQYQRPVMYVVFDSMGTIVSKTSYLFSVTNNKVKLTNEIFETYKQSMDSDKNMKIVVLTEYIF